MWRLYQKWGLQFCGASRGLEKHRVLKNLLMIFLNFGENFFFLKIFFEKNFLLAFSVLKLLAVSKIFFTRDT